MPELPEVEMVVRGLRPEIEGKRFGLAAVFWPPLLAGMDPELFAARLEGQRVQRLYRRGKYVVFDLTDDYLFIHLKMTGRLYVSAPLEHSEADRWLRAVLPLDSGLELRFSDLRKFGRLLLAAEAEEVIGHLGPEPLEDGFTAALFRERLAGRSAVLKTLLLDQSCIAGIGNIYADEALWQARIDPRRKTDTLTENEAERLYEAVRTTLQSGIEHEGSSISWYRKPDGTAGEYQKYFSVYGRLGEPCPRCGAPIAKIRLGQRGTHYCPTCQQ